MSKAPDRTRKAHADTVRLNSRVSVETLRYFRDKDRKTWDLLWSLTKWRIKNETGLTESRLYARTWNAMGTMYREEDPAEWARVRDEVRQRIVSETGWEDGRAIANKQRVRAEGTTFTVEMEVEDKDG